MDAKVDGTAATASFTRRMIPRFFAGRAFFRAVFFFAAFFAEGFLAAFLVVAMRRTGFAVFRFAAPVFFAAFFFAAFFVAGFFLAFLAMLASSVRQTDPSQTITPPNFCKRPDALLHCNLQQCCPQASIKGGVELFQLRGDHARIFVIGDRIRVRVAG